MDFVAHYESASLLSSSVSGGCLFGGRLRLGSARLRAQPPAPPRPRAPARRFGGRPRALGLGSAGLGSAPASAPPARLPTASAAVCSTCGSAAASPRPGAAVLRRRLGFSASARRPAPRAAGRGRRSGRGLISPGSAGLSRDRDVAGALADPVDAAAGTGAPALQRRALVGVGGRRRPARRRRGRCCSRRWRSPTSAPCRRRGRRRASGTPGSTAPPRRACRGCARAPAAPCARTSARSGPAPGSALVLRSPRHAQRPFSLLVRSLP